MSRAGAGVERVSQAEDAQMPMWSDQGLKKVFPTSELTTATCEAEHQRCQMRHEDEVAGEDPPAGVRTSSPVLCGRCTVNRWLSLIIFVRQKVTTSGVVPCWQRSSKLEAAPRMVFRRDGAPALLAHVRAARAMTMVSDVPLESVHEQVSKKQSPGNGLSEGAVKGLKVRIRTSRHNKEMGLSEANPRDS